MDFKKIILILGVCIIVIGAILYAGYHINSNKGFYDMGTSSNKTNDWICNNVSLVQITPNGTLLNNTSPEKLAYIAHSTDFWVHNPSCVEFNVVNVVGNPTIHIYDGNNSFYGNLSKAKGAHVKIYVNDTISWSIGDKEQTPLNKSVTINNNCYVRFVVPHNSVIKFNDFKIYSI